MSRCCMNSSMVHPGVNRCAYSARTQATKGHSEKQVLLVAQGARGTLPAHPLRPGDVRVTQGNDGEPVAWLTCLKVERCAPWDHKCATGNTVERVQPPDHGVQQQCGTLHWAKAQLHRRYCVTAHWSQPHTRYPVAQHV